jgi:hypothetical protein
VRLPKNRGMYDCQNVDWFQVAADPNKDEKLAEYCLKQNNCRTYDLSRVTDNPAQSGSTIRDKLSKRENHEACLGANSGTA